jgi:hypothetical protein
MFRSFIGGTHSPRSGFIYFFKPGPFPLNPKEFLHSERPYYWSLERRANKDNTRLATLCGSLSSCCQIRRTCQPRERRVLLTNLSLALFRISLFRQKRTLEAGREACSGQLCQKQPSTKITIRNFGKTKSGVPKIGKRRLQPEILYLRKI